jgi:putative membrane protein
MGRLTVTERQGVEAAIAKAEKATTAEFVAVVARRADRYHVASLVAGILGALAAGVLAYGLDPWGSIALGLGAEGLGFGIVYGLFELTTIGVRLAPRRAREVKSRRLAHLLFLDRGLAGLPARNGVLLLVALAERQVEIVADRAIDELAGSAEWQRIVEVFTSQARSGDVARALEAAILDLGRLLARHYPAGAGDRNHLPDRLIEL